MMNEEKIAEAARVLTGLKRHEWSKLKITIERMYDSAACKIALDDTESIQRNIALEFGVTNNQ